MRASYLALGVAVALAGPASADLPLAGLLAIQAGKTLPDPGDTAAIIDLRTGAIVFEHHPTVARRTRMAPGSVMKAFTAYALLDAGLEHFEHTCRGAHVDPFGVERTCWDRTGHGPRRLRTALADSCNVWFYEAVSRVEPAVVLSAWRQLGLPSKGGDGVVPDEIPASVEPRDLPDVAAGDHRALGLTARSLLDATARLATRDARGGLDPAHLELIAHGLEEAAQSGTLKGTFAGVPVPVAAKSGTAPRAGRGMRGLVIGWIPAEKPRFAWVVVKDRGRGARDAGPAARALVDVLAELVK